MVGVNAFVQENDLPIEILYIDESAAETQLAKLEVLRKTDAVRRSLEKPPRRRARRKIHACILDAVRTHATVGEMCDAPARCGRYIDH
jgi:methylmalonyl-CoA mutase N-terminal domain/subunit